MLFSVFNCKDQDFPLNSVGLNSVCIGLLELSSFLTFDICNE